MSEIEWLQEPEHLLIRTLQYTARWSQAEPGADARGAGGAVGTDAGNRRGRARGEARMTMTARSACSRVPRVLPMRPPRTGSAQARDVNL
jgi:hypothetical protein